MGESHDARLDLGAWSSPGFDDTGWLPGVLSPDPGISLDAGIGPAVRRIEELAPIRQWARSVVNCGQASVFDLGQNFTGRVRLTVRARRATTLTIRHAEVLDRDGSLYLDNLRGARATDHYTRRGPEPESWEPKFTFQGFRYVEVSGLEAGDTVEVCGVVLHSDMPVIGDFECSNPLLNQLQRNILWGQKSNFLKTPTDCPQRDERLGWAGDAQVFIRTAAFNMDVRTFFHKWLRDVRDAQGADGEVPPVIPDIGVLWGLPDGGPAWSDAVIICPWTVYLCYGDRTILEDQLEAHGRLEVAYRLLEQETFPSWLFPVKNAATTIWECWDGWTPDKGFQDKSMNSFNHYAYGAVGAWMYRTVAGLELDPAEPGYRHIIFRPRPGGSLTWAKARLATPHGDAAISWKLEGGALQMELLVPEGARATIHAPEGFTPEPGCLGKGTHHLLFQRSPC